MTNIYGDQPLTGRTKFRGVLDTTTSLRIGGGVTPLLGLPGGPFEGKPLWTAFTGGLIDEVRISNIIRYPREKLDERLWRRYYRSPDRELQNRMSTRLPYGISNSMDRLVPSGAMHLETDITLPIMGTISVLNLLKNCQFCGVNSRDNRMNTTKQIVLVALALVATVSSLNQFNSHSEQKNRIRNERLIKPTPSRQCCCYIF